MKKYISLCVFLFGIIIPFLTFSQNTVTAGFTSPDTVCANTPVNVINTSTGATSYYWSFCAADFSTTPEAVNLGNPGGLLNSPVFGGYMLDDNGNYYGLTVNYTAGELIRLNFGNSLLNNPTAEDLGDFGGIIPAQAEGIQVLRVNGNWFAIIVGGGNQFANSSPRIVKIDFGNSLANLPTATNWGNVGGLNLPHDLYITREAGIYYGFAINVNDNTITRLTFGPDFTNTPTGINLGNIGNIDYPAGFTFVKYNQNWFALIANRVTNSLTRLSFGTSLLNTPTGVNIGNPGGLLSFPRDVSLFTACDGIYGFVVNEQSNDIVKLNFGFDLTSTPQAVDLGNLGNLDFPHSISDFFRVGNDIYAFIPNVYNNTLTRIRFAGCQDIPGSGLQNPNAFTYQQPGTYNINLLVDLGLPTQTSFCKQIVVKNCLSETCNNWLYLPSQPSAVQVGDLDVPGNQVTVEAMINRTTPYTGGTLYAGDIVSKHKDPTDANYLLRPNEAEITTTNGYFRTPDICEIGLDKTYHVAMVYDGSTLKFYRNGFLMSQVAATGNLYQNDWPTRIGYYYSEIFNTNFIGYINEVRIWNIARTQAQIQTYMNSPLPSPVTQSGLLAYYTFDDLVNKQGNTAWNGTLVGSAIINQINPTCAAFSADSCCITPQGSLTGSNICSGGTATLTFNATAGTGPFTLTYSDGISTYTQNNVLSGTAFILPNPPLKNTIYTLFTIQDATNCPSATVSDITATVVVTLFNQAQLSGGDICIGDDGILLFTATGGAAPFNIQYANGVNTYTLGNVNNNAAFTIPYALTDTTSFNLITVTDANGCVDSANSTTAINVRPLPQGGISAGNTVCGGDSVSISFTASSGTAPFEIVISDGSDNNTYYGILSGIPFNIAPLKTSSIISLVAVTDQDGNGCTRTTGFITPRVIISLNPVPQIQFDTLGSICADKAPFLINQASETSGIPGTGAFSGQGVDASGNFSPSLSGAGMHAITYTFTGSDGCIASQSQNIVVNSNPVAVAGADLIGCTGVSVQLHASGGGSYAWSPVTGLSDPSVANPVVTINTTATYTVTITDSNGCSAADSLTISISPVGKAIYVVPNAFTPNGDGKNDCFGIRHWGGITLQEFSVFNRWGQRVFATKNPSECWDGSFNGTMQDAGTYVYMIHAQTPCGEISLKGTLILVR